MATERVGRGRFNGLMCARNNGYIALGARVSSARRPETVKSLLESSKWFAGVKTRKRHARAQRERARMPPFEMLNSME